MVTNQELIERLKRMQEDTQFIMQHLAINTKNESITLQNFERIAHDTANDRSITTGALIRACYLVSENLDDMIDELDFNS
jgi:hypothetical protein